MSFVKTDIELTKRFIDGLKEYNLTKDEIKDWTYVGGGHTTDARLNTILNQTFKIHFPDSDVPELEHTCVCGHPIQLNAFISDGERILVLGSCCVKRFTATGIKKTCRKCKKPYRGSYLDCSACRPGVFGEKVCKTCGCIYRFVCSNCSH